MFLKLNYWVVLFFYCANYLQGSYTLHMQYTDFLIPPELLFTANLCSCLSFLLTDSDSFSALAVSISTIVC